MERYTTDEVKAARAPLASLLSKSEKAQQKVAPGTWQHSMLGRNIAALRLALSLIGEAEGGPREAASEELESALRALDAMIERVANTARAFAPGTSQHSLQRNRLEALRLARAAVLARLGGA